MPKDLVFELSPTQSAFVHSTAHICHLTGGFGEGKTFAGVAAMIAHARRCRQNIRAAIIRDTHQNIKTSTVPSIQEILGDWVVFKDNYKKMYIKSRPAIECDLFGIDDPASESKLQGPEYALIWLEEPAPIHEKANAGLPKSVFDLSLARASRQKGTVPRVQITQNPGDENHWTTDLLDEPEEYMTVRQDDGSTITIVKQTFHIRKGENKFLSSLARAMAAAAFKDDPGKWARYVEGLVATVQIGKPVTPGYSPVIHFSQKILPVYPNFQGFRGWDGYQHPACVTAQYNPFGQFVIHDVLYDEGVGTQELIEEQLLPLLATPKYKGKIRSWRDIGDPSMATPDQSSTTRSAAKLIQKKLNTHFERGATRWRRRIDPVNHALKRMLNEGRPAIILSASATPLNKALKGGWHYKTDNNGRIIGEKPVQNSVHSHPGNAFVYLISQLMPYSIEEEVRKATDEARRESRMRRAASYGSADPRRIPMPGGVMPWR